MKKVQIVRVKYGSRLNLEDVMPYLDYINSKVGDIVLVETNDGVAIAKVFEIEELGDVTEKMLPNYKLVVEKIKSKYFDDLAKEDKIKEIKAKMKEKIKALDEIEQYRFYASKDADMKSLLIEYESLIK